MPPVWAAGVDNAAPTASLRLQNLPANSKVFVDRQLVKPEGDLLCLAPGIHWLQVEWFQVPAASPNAAPEEDAKLLDPDAPLKSRPVVPTGVFVFRAAVTAEEKKTITIAVTATPVFPTNAGYSVMAMRGAYGPMGPPGPPGKAADVSRPIDVAAARLVLQEALSTLLRELDTPCEIIERVHNGFVEKGAPPTVYWYSPLGESASGPPILGPVGPPGRVGPPGIPGDVQRILDEKGQPLLDLARRQAGLDELRTILTDLRQRTSQLRRPRSVMQPITILSPELNQRLLADYTRLNKETRPFLLVEGPGASLKQSPAGPPGPPGPPGRLSPSREEQLALPSNNLVSPNRESKQETDKNADKNINRNASTTQHLIGLPIAPSNLTVSDAEAQQMVAALLEETPFKEELAKMRARTQTLMAQIEQDEKEAARLRLEQIVLDDLSFSGTAETLIAQRLRLERALATKDEAALRTLCNEFFQSLDSTRIAKDYPGAVRDILSVEPEKQKTALATLSATGLVEAIPWIVPLLDSPQSEVRVWAGSYLEKLVVGQILKRRDMSVPQRVLIKPRTAQDTDFRPLAWVLMRMLKKEDDGNTHGYAATMIGYIGLREFEPELRELLKSRHPAVTRSAQYALKLLAEGNQ